MPPLEIHGMIDFGFQPGNLGVKNLFGLLNLGFKKLTHLIHGSIGKGREFFIKFHLVLFNENFLTGQSIRVKLIKYFI